MLAEIVTGSVCAEAVECSPSKPAARRLDARLRLERLCRSLAGLTELGARQGQSDSEVEGAELVAVLETVSRDLDDYLGELEADLAPHGAAASHYRRVMRQHVLRCCARQRAEIAKLLRAARRAGTGNGVLGAVWAAALVMRVEVETLAEDARAVAASG